LTGINFSNKKANKLTEKTTTRVQDGVIIVQEFVGCCLEGTGEGAMLRMYGGWVLPGEKSLSVRSGFCSHWAISFV